MRSIPKGWKELEIKDFLKLTPREVEKPKRQYRSLGIRSHCKGTFIREVEDPDKVMMKILYEVKKDDLIVNITFAWEGAVALVNKSDEGALVSHRFPTYVFDRNVAVPDFFRYLIPSKRFVYNLGVISPGGAGRNRVLDRKDFMCLQFIMPPVEEQKVIAEVISTWDRAIETLSKLINAKAKLKKGLMQKMLTGKMRFNEFNGKRFEKTSLGQVAKINMGQSPSSEFYNEDRAGLPLIQGNGDCKDRKTFPTTYTKQITKRAYIGDIIMSVRAPVGTIAKCMHEACIGRGVCAIRGEKIDNEYLYQFLLSLETQWNSYAQGSTFTAVNSNDIKKLPLAFPVDEKEQKKIAKLLLSADNELEILSSTLDMLKIQKKGLMQKLLTGKIRVNI